PRNLKPGDLVLKKALYVSPDPRGKFKPNWEDPYVIKEIFGGGGARIMDIDGNEFTKPINLDKLKKYYV
ncbi:hypothetical protein, partial [Vibrio vulnificus]